MNMRRHRFRLVTANVKLGNCNYGENEYARNLH